MKLHSVDYKDWFINQKRIPDKESEEYKSFFDFHKDCDMWEWQNLLSELFLEVYGMQSIDMKSMGAMHGWADMGGLELPTHRPLQPWDFPRTAFTSKCYRDPRESEPTFTCDQIM